MRYDQIMAFKLDLNSIYLWEVNMNSVSLVFRSFPSDCLILSIQFALQSREHSLAEAAVCRMPVKCSG